MENLTDENTLLLSGLVSELGLTGYGCQLCGYEGRHYICDIVSEIADSNTSIYYSDIKNYISENVDNVNEAINELGWDGCGSDLMKAGQMAEYLDIERQIYENLDETLLHYCYSYLLNTMSVSEITQEQRDEIVEKCSGVDNNDTLDEFEDFLRDLLISDCESGV